MGPIYADSAFFLDTHPYVDFPVLILSHKNCNSTNYQSTEHAFVKLTENVVSENSWHVWTFLTLT